MKYAHQIVKWGKIKPFFDKTYSFNTIDIETIDIFFKDNKIIDMSNNLRFFYDMDYRTHIINKLHLKKRTNLFMLGFTHDKKHHVIFDNFYNQLHDFLIKCVQNHKDILTWSRYDNTHLLKLILSKVNKKDINQILLRVNKLTPIYRYKYKGFTFTIVNIIKDSIIFKLTDYRNKSRNVIIYNLKNLYHTNLEKTAENYNLSYYSKMSIEYHIINKKRFNSDIDYQRGVIESNRLDNIVLLDIAKQMLDNFKLISGEIPKSIFTNGSLARSYLLSQIGIIGSKNLNFKVLFSKSKFKKQLLDYSMRSYHGGKIESYILGYVPKAKIIDITSAYPYSMSLLPKLTNKVIYDNDPKRLQKYFYAFIKVEIEINDPNLIHPVIKENPINKSNISPYGFLNTIITKIEYDYLIKKECKVKIIDYYAIEHEDSYPYKSIVTTLFNERMKYKNSNKSLSQMYKIILNSLYGITYELTDLYTEIDGKIEWIGYRAGDFFMPVIASYITAITRTYLSDVSHNIILNGGEVLLNMTDSIIYHGNCTLDVFSDKKILGKFEQPELIKDIYILGAGRYEYKNEFTNKFTIKNRGFNVSVKDKSFYGNLDLNSNISLVHKTFVTSFKASTKKYAYEKMGYLIDDTYNINPFNLGGKRVIINENVNLNNDFTKTKPVYLEKGLRINENEN